MDKQTFPETQSFDVFSISLCVCSLGLPCCFPKGKRKRFQFKVVSGFIRSNFPLSSSSHSFPNRPWSFSERCVVLPHHPSTKNAERPKSEWEEVEFILMQICLPICLIG